MRSSLNVCCSVAFGLAVEVHTGRSCSRGQSSTAPRLFRSFQTLEALEQTSGLLGCRFAETIASSWSAW